MTDRKGLVSFVGSGPGDPDLLTLKAVDRIKRADVILFDDLSSGPILDYANPAATIIGVGKRAGKKSPKQDHISKMLVGHAQTGIRVVRLKSGDSGLFGRLEEELIAVRQFDIAYEIIPGIPSAIAAAAACGIPLTRRLNARRVQFVTGHGIDGKLPQDLNIISLADPNASTIIFMGKRTFPQLAQRLIAHGLSPDTPAILAHSVGTPDQSLHRTNITELAQELAQDISDKPALIIYGPLAQMGVGYDE